MRCVVLGISLLLVAACSGAEPGSSDSPQADPATTAPAPAAEPAAVPQISADTCAPGPGKQVTELPDMVVPELVVPDFRSAEAVVDGQTVPAVVVPGYSLPEQVADAGCEIVYDAPAGCLPATQISDARLPGRVVPDRVVPEQRLPDGRVIPAEVLPGGTREPQVSPGGRAEQVCQVERTGDRIIGSVIRGSLIRGSLIRGSIIQGSLVRGSECGSNGCVPGLVVPGVVVPGVVLPGTVLPGAVLAGRVLDRAPDVEVLTGESSTAFVTPGDLLFDTGSSALRPEALASIDAVAVQVLALAGTAAVTVEGHTDDVGADADNQALSERRAAADRLVTGGVPRERLTVRGLGETAPASLEDTAEGRQTNRRVVVGVAAK